MTNDDQTEPQQPLESNTTDPKTPRRSLLGALEHLGISVSEEDIAEMRREAWKNFPRDLPEDNA